MKKRLSLISIILVFVLILSFASCQVKPNQELDTTAEPSTVSVASAENIQNNEDLYKSGEFSLSGAVLLPQSRLLLTYKNDDVFFFKTYDIKTQKFLSASQEYQMNVYHYPEIKLLKNNFYIVSRDKIYIFDFECKLIKELNIPNQNFQTLISIPYIWISNNLEKALYIKNPDNEFDALFLSDLNDIGGKSEKVITRFDDKNLFAGVTQAFFSSDDSVIGFSGQHFPSMGEQSVDSYGYIDLKTNEIKDIPLDRTYTTMQGDTMLISYKTGPYCSKKAGQVITLDLKTKEQKEIKTVVPDECENFNIASDPAYTFGIYSEKQAVGFTVYKDGKKIAQIKHQCSSEQEVVDITTGTTMFDVETQNIIILYHDTSLKRMNMKMIHVDI